ncbi:hypothetical protein BDD12DRAFT_849613 [Trichophaea hybrida]|nr:hypothetical protein BDD12DRAFT_849613 [Trichophaea hybrida]
MHKVINPSSFPMLLRNPPPPPHRLLKHLLPNPCINPRSFHSHRRCLNSQYLCHFPSGIGRRVQHNLNFHRLCIRNTPPSLYIIVVFQHDRFPLLFIVANRDVGWCECAGDVPWHSTAWKVAVDTAEEVPEGRCAEHAVAEEDGFAAPGVGGARVGVEERVGDGDADSARGEF